MTERVFAMPDLGEGLDEGEIVAWLVAEGDTVTLNQPLVEIETAKATVEIPSPHAGIVTSLHGSVGEAIAVGSPLATFQVDGPGLGPTAGTGEQPVAELGEHPTREPRSDPVSATPPVRKLARSLGVDLAAVTGTGPGGRITAEDVKMAVGAASSNTASAGVTEPAEEGVEHLPLTPTRRTIAENLSMQAAIPQVTTFRTVDCEALHTFHKQRQVSPLPVVIAALCRTVHAHPLLNASWGETEILVRDRIDVGLAVDTERGLIVPVIRGAEQRGIGELATEINRLATAAREGSLDLHDMTARATIAVSNTGSYGSEAGTPLLSPNTSVTLAIGVIGRRALVTDGEVMARLACTLSCTFDHRVLDGAAVGRALTDLVSSLEDLDRLGDLPA